MASTIVFIVCASACVIMVIVMKTRRWWQPRLELRRTVKREMKDLDQEYEDLLKRLNLHGV
jgi:hypothetical protein